MPRRTQQIANPCRPLPRYLAHLRPLRLNDFGRCVRWLCSCAVLPFIVIAFCCSSVSLELFPFLIHFACLWHVQACLAQAPSAVYVMSSLCIQRCNLLQIYAATNQNKQKLHVHSQLIRYLPCTLSLSLSLTLSFSLSLSVPLSMQIQLTLQRVGSLLSPSPTAWRAFNLSQELSQHLQLVVATEASNFRSSHSIPKCCRTLEQGAGQGGAHPFYV